MKFTTRTIEVEPSRKIRVVYSDVAFRGDATWCFEPHGGDTIVSRHGSTDPAGILRALAPFLPISKSHSDTTKLGLERLARHLQGTSSTPAATHRA